MSHKHRHGHGQSFPGGGGDFPPTSAYADMSLIRWEAQPGTGDNTRAMDMSDALVNKPENADAIRVMYGGLWRGQQNPNALKVSGAIRQRQYDVWNWGMDSPGETLLKSTDYVAYNSWATNGNYIKNAVVSSTDPADVPSIPPGQSGYRSPPGQPGYTGPYWTQTTA